MLTSLEVVEDIVTDILVQPLPVILDSDILRAATEKYQEPCQVQTEEEQLLPVKYYEAIPLDDKEFPTMEILW